jgi:uncharacterized protein
MRGLFQSFKTDLGETDRRVGLALIYTAIGLSCIFYLGDAQKFVEILARAPFAEYGALVLSAENNLPALTYWALVVTLFYFAIPALIIKFVWRQNLSEYGLNLKFEKGFGELYLQCAAIMLPLVYLMSLTEGFANKYPFFRVYNDEPYFGRDFLIWEALYFLQFFGLEFFFRGFLVQSLKPKLGVYSIFVMTVPYCMIHFGKPMPETFAAIFAGIFLGWLSYKYNNIWLGLLLHCTVALAMDVLALHHKGLLF